MPTQLQFELQFLNRYTFYINVETPAWLTIVKLDLLLWK